MLTHDALMAANLALTGCMTGLIWFVQIVHYPLMWQDLGPSFPAWHAAHTRRTTCVVAPLMFLEMLVAGMLAVRPGDVGAPVASAALALLAVAWASTFMIQVPLHGRLSHGFDPEAHRALCRSNWIRTLAWTCRLALLLAAASRTSA